MISIIILLIVIANLLAARRRNGPPIMVSGPRFYAIFAIILLMHVTVIGTLMALHHWKHF